MCGIAGIAKKSSTVDEQMLLKMRDSMKYRGPDDAGIWIDLSKSVGLAHRRLSILDPTPSGYQPMTDPLNGNIICYNGEVYNYIEIRNELKKKGYKFQTGTDTEVILKAYSAYGEDCIKSFNGMFAFAIWDAHKRQLFMARDRIGIKPFYYKFTDNGDLFFASEVKAIRLSGNVHSEIHYGLIDQYMSFGYVPGLQTLEKGIKRLQPGHSATYKDGNLSITKYWDLCFNQNKDLGFEYYMEQSQELLRDSISLRLRSDVPLGIFLSGGLDSSAVVGLLASEAPEKLKTFSVAYDFGQDFNETKYARIVSEKFQTDHHELFVTAEDFKNFIPDFSYLMDEPVAESAAISLQLLSSLTKEYVTVVLSGEGADEVFGGYDLYRYMRSIDTYRKAVSAPIAHLISRVGTKILPENSKLRKYSDWAGVNLESRYKGISTYEERYKDLLYNRDFKDHLKKHNEVQVENFLEDLMRINKDKDPLSRMLYFDVKTWLVDDLLIKADRMSMSASLELRVPFLDYRLVEFAAAMPSKYKVRNGKGKFILKKMMEGILPHEIIYRKKMGFPTPLKQMFQSGLSEYASDLLLSRNTKIHSIFDKKQIQILLERHIRKKSDHHRTIWQLVVLEEWMNNVARYNT